jgi:TRAP-type C4-dicarboxylate transport system permease small subunit
MNILHAAKRGLELALAVFSVLLIAALFLLVVFAVVYRELGASLTWYDEVATVLLAWLTYYGSALAALRRGHLGSPEILRLAPPRLRLPLFILAEALVIAFFLVLGWAGLEVVILLQGDTLISLPWVPVQLTQSVIPVGAVLFIVAQLLSVPDEWTYLRHGRAPQEQI